jgi:AcrR family transcriptional regulator
LLKSTRAVPSETLGDPTRRGTKRFAGKFHAALPESTFGSPAAKRSLEASAARQRATTSFAPGEWFWQQSHRGVGPHDEDLSELTLFRVRTVHGLFSPAALQSVCSISKLWYSCLAMKWQPAVRPNAYGRSPKKRGLITRQKLLDAVAEMIEEMPYHELRVAEIARRAGTSAATFYHYFGDVATAVLEIVDEHAQRFCIVIDSALIHTRDGQMTWEAASAVAGEFLQFWQLHRGLLRMVDTATEEDDIRFFKLRDRVLTSITETLANCVPPGRPGHEIDPIATAGALVMMLTHVTARSGRYERSGYSVAVLQRSMAHILISSLTPDGQALAPSTNRRTTRTRSRS